MVNFGVQGLLLRSHVLFLSDVFISLFKWKRQKTHARRTWLWQYARIINWRGGIFNSMCYHCWPNELLFLGHIECSTCIVQWSTSPFSIHIHIRRVKNPSLRLTLCIEFMDNSMKAFQHGCNVTTENQCGPMQGLFPWPFANHAICTGCVWESENERKEKKK